MYSLQQISKFIHADCIGHADTIIRHLLTDSRNTADASSSLFIAIKGERHNGHQYIDELYKRGVRSFLVSEKPETSKYTEAGFMVVKDTLEAFQSLCTQHRNKFNIPVIGITGSNGKTIVKEWLYQLLRNDYNICRSPKSYNSQIGVPLSVWQLNEEHSLGIFEAGISRPGEMEKLEKIIRPTIGIVTNIGSAHDEGFKNNKEKIQEKLKLFSHCERLVYCCDNEQLHEQLKNKNAFTWSRYQQQANLFIAEVSVKPDHSIIQAIHNNTTINIRINFTDTASVENAISCWATLLLLGYDNKVIANRMLQLHAVAMRLEMKQGINNCMVINDSYNSDLASLSIALDFLNQQKQHPRKTLVLSDILQSGKSEEELYRQVAALIKTKGINTLVGIGPALSAHADLFELEKRFFTSTEEFLKSVYSLTPLCFTNSTVLLKGARSFGFENINAVLQQKSHDTVLEINLNHLIDNINYYKSKLKPGTKLMCMVKASSYGSGSHEIAATLQYQRVDYLAVAYADEGVELRKAGITLPIMVMSPEEQAFEDILNYKLEPEIFSFRILHLFTSFLEKNNQAAFPIHLKIDTGMHRLGFEENETEQLIRELKDNKTIQLRSVFSHLAASDNPEMDDFTKEQINLFKKISAQIDTAITGPVLKHICNSGAISRFPEAHFDMVRLGIGLYGVGVNNDEQKHLHNVSSLKTTISQLKHLQAGDTVGYSRRGKINRPSLIATVPIGYADGFSRKLGNGNGHMYIKGQKAPIIGSVCMDMCMLDVTGIDCNEGDEVIVFDSVEKLNELALKAETISYEILTSVSTRVKRVYVQE